MDLRHWTSKAGMTDKRDLCRGFAVLLSISTWASNRMACRAIGSADPTGSSKEDRVSLWPDISASSR
jgi:hypothetical protein